jgi:hypothetical protein
MAIAAADVYHRADALTAFFDIDEDDLLVESPTSTSASAWSISTFGNAN